MGDSRAIIDKSDIEKELALIEYPGVVKNVDKMLETLGGLPKISQVFCGEKRRMELRFHPKNVFNRPACGDLHLTTGLLLRVKVRKNKIRTEEPSTHLIEILGRCKKTVKFDSLCDYQYLPIVKNEKTGKDEYIYDKIVPKGIPDKDWWSEIDTPLFCAPGVFARSDTIHTETFRKDLKESPYPDILDVNRGKQLESPQFQQFNLIDPFPTTALPDVAKRMTVKYVSDSQLEKVTKLFEECPIWNRISLLYESGISNDKMKTILPSVSFYFSSGPWRTFYCRLGYDPRKDFHSRYYQMIDFRIRCQPGVTEHIKVKAKARKEASRAEQQQASPTKSWQDPGPSTSWQQPGPSTSWQQHGPSKSRQQHGASTSRQQSQPVVQDINYPYFEEGRLPRYRQCIYRYCDLKVPRIIEMLEKIPTPLTGATCNEKSGWLPSGFDDQCRQILNACIREQLKNVQKTQKIKEDEEMEESEYSEDEDDEEDNMDEEFEQLLEEMDYADNLQE